MHLDLWAKHARLWWSPALVRGPYLGCWPAALLSSYRLLGQKAARDGASLQSLLNFVPAESWSYYWIICMVLTHKDVLFFLVGGWETMASLFFLWQVPCPVVCRNHLGAWEEWSTCSAMCDVGHRWRLRKWTAEGHEFLHAAWLHWAYIV